MYQVELHFHIIIGLEIKNTNKQTKLFKVEIKFDFCTYLLPLLCNTEQLVHNEILPEEKKQVLR